MLSFRHTKQTSKNVADAIFKLLLNIRIILSSSKIQLLQKQQFLNYFVKNLKSLIFYILPPLSKKVLEICTPLSPIKMLIFLRANDKRERVKKTCLINSLNNKENQMMKYFVSSIP